MSECHQRSISFFKGKTSAAVSLARHYSTACLSIDSVVMEAISDRSSSAGLRARELCIKATIEQAQREAEEAGKQSKHQEHKDWTAVPHRKMADTTTVPFQ